VNVHKLYSEGFQVAMIASMDANYMHGYYIADKNSYITLPKFLKFRIP
jgi:hypothetical protein